MGLSLLQVICNNKGVRWDWDKLGGTASFLCAIHCVLTGVAMGLLSTLGLQFFADPKTEYTFMGIAVVAGLLAIYTGVRKHHLWWPSGLFAAGMGALIVRHVMFPHAHAHHADGVVCCQPPAIATALSVGGGCLLVAFHVLNGWKAHHATCSSSLISAPR